MKTTNTTTRKPKTTKKFYIGERGNPQFAKSYFVGYGQLSKTDVKKKEECAYGSMTLTAYETEAEYNAALVKIEAEGFRVTKQ